MVTTSALSNLITFIYGSNSSLESVAEYLVVETFSDLAPMGIFLGIPEASGSPIISNSFSSSEDLETDEIFEIAARLTPQMDHSDSKKGLVYFSDEEILTANIKRKGKKLIFPLGFDLTIEVPFRYSERGIIFFYAKGPERYSLDTFG